MKNQSAVLAIIATVLLACFQNCAKMTFTPATDATLANQSSTTANGGSNTSSNANGDSNSNTTPADSTTQNSSPDPSATPAPGDVVDIGVVKDFMCTQFVELTYDPSQILNIPKRDSSGNCYLVKIISKANYNPSSLNPLSDADVVSRNHDTGPTTHHPYNLGEAMVRMILAGERTIKLSGGKNDTNSITVDNFILVGVAATSQIGDPSYYKAYGTSDATIPNSDSILFKNSAIPLTAFASGGTSTIAPLSLEGQIVIGQDSTLDIRALDCGGIGVVSDIYLLFQ